MIDLRHYQRQWVADVNASLRDVQRVCLCAPTGSGKRRLACWYCSGIANRGRRVLVVTDRRILVHQMADECKDHEINYGIIMGDEPTNPDAPVQIASIQTLKIRKWKECPDADWIIHDEAHKDPQGISKLLSRYPNAKYLGLTATPVDQHGKRLDHVQRVVEPVQNSRLIKDGYLLPVTCLTPCEPDVKGVKLSSGEYNQAQLGERVQQCIVFANVFKWWAPYSNLQTICFVPGVKFAYGFCEQFQDRGHSAEVIEGGTDKRERQDIFERFRDGSTRVLVSVDVLREGFDAPEANCGLDLQPNKQLRTYWQKVGRIKRPHEGVEKATWLDFAGNFWRHLHPDEDPPWPEGTETTGQLLEQAKREPGSKEPWSCPSCAYTLSPWERMQDGKCPGCGQAVKKSIRRIVMGDGRMKTVSAKQRTKKKSDDAVKVWFGCLYPCFYRGFTVHQAARFYHEKTGRWPDEDKLPFVPSRGSGDWKRPVKSVFPQLKKSR